MAGEQALALAIRRLAQINEDDLTWETQMCAERVLEFKYARKDELMLILQSFLVSPWFFEIAAMVAFHRVGLLNYFPLLSEMVRRNNSVADRIEFVKIYLATARHLLPCSRSTHDARLDFMETKNLYLASLTEFLGLFEEKDRGLLYEEVTWFLQQALQEDPVTNLGAYVVEFFLEYPKVSPRCLAYVREILIRQEEVDFMAIKTIHSELGKEAVEPFLKILESDNLILMRGCATPQVLNFFYSHRFPATSRGDSDERVTLPHRKRPAVRNHGTLRGH